MATCEAVLVIQYELISFVPGTLSGRTLLHVFLLDEANGLEWLEMPTVFRQEGFEFMIYTDDHLPAHVHVFKAEGEVIINLGDNETRVSVRENNRMPNRNERRAVVIAGDNQVYLLARWRRIHG